MQFATVDTLSTNYDLLDLPKPPETTETKNVNRISFALSNPTETRNEERTKIDINSIRIVSGEITKT